MKRLLALVFALIALPALADVQAGNGKDYVRLQETPCPPAVLALLPNLPADKQALFRAALSHVDGKDYRACWTLLPDGRVFLRYEDGDAGLIPATDFKAVPTS